MKINQDILNQALGLLASILDRDEQATPIHLIICGGSSLIMLGLVTRTTRDVDILAYLTKTKDNTNSLEYASVLPPFLIHAAEQVAANLGLDKSWLNTGPKDLVRYGLPQGFLERLHPKNYGKKLNISFIDRIDQIHFKMYAAVDSGPGRHVNDLLALNPTAYEMEQAAKWAVQQDPSPEFKAMLIEMLEALNYETIAKKL